MLIKRTNRTRSETASRGTIAESLAGQATGLDRRTFLRTAALSATNSEIFGAGRILFGRWNPTAEQGRWFTANADGTDVRSLGVTATLRSEGVRNSP